MVVLPPGAIGGGTEPYVTQVSATLMAISEHGLFYWEQGLEPEEAVAQEAARKFEEEVRPAVTAVFGEEPMPGIDGDPRLTVLHASLGGGAGGYVAGADALPRWAYRYSNEREMVYLDASTSPGSGGYAALIAHEYQHVIHIANDPTEDSWVNEGLSEVAAGLVGSYSGQRADFIDDPLLQLNAWKGDAGHYGAADLWFHYLAQRFGGMAVATAIAREPDDGVFGVRAALESLGAPALEAILGDWAAANYADLRGTIYGYDDIDVSLEPTAALGAGETLARSVPQFAADYVELEGSGVVTYTFSGAATVSAIPAEPPSGKGMWWSNAGEVIDTRLTRSLDLSAVESATLVFNTWYDVEKGWDFGYVAVSPDGGATWEIVSGQHSVTFDPIGNAFGPAYTGISGGGDTPEWVEERIDLTPYAGREVLIRFEYVTDDGLHMDGWAIDGIAVPEIGFADDAEDAGRWESEGWAMLDSQLPQRFELRLIQGEAVTVIAVDEANRATFDVGLSLGPAVLVVAAVTGGSVAPASYEIASTSP